MSEDVQPPLKSEVDIADAIDTAKRAVENAGDDTTYAELMANYVDLGTLLEAWNRSELDMTAEEFEATCRDSIERSIELGKAREREEAQRWAVYFLKHSGVWLGEHA